jgi:hypothetical protein
MTQQAISPFAKSSLGTMMGRGAPLVQIYDVTALAASGTINLTNFPMPITQGQLRIKNSAPNAATTTAIATVTGTDGTNTVILQSNVLAATAAGGYFDLLIPFNSDLQLTTISIALTLAGTTTTETIASELFGNP